MLNQAQKQTLFVDNVDNMHYLIDRVDLIFQRANFEVLIYN